MIFPICGIWWLNWTTKQNRDKFIDTEHADSSSGGGGGGYWMGVEGLSKKEKTKERELMDVDNKCGDCSKGERQRWKRTIEGINGDGIKENKTNGNNNLKISN